MWAKYYKLLKTIIIMKIFLALFIVIIKIKLNKDKRKIHLLSDFWSKVHVDSSIGMRLDIWY